jgi:low temperature requirement protein LtrA
VVTGATAADTGLDAKESLALAIAFVQTGALWWLYFGEIAVHSRRHMRESEDAVALARDAYTYLHLPIVAGIILSAVADDLLLADVSEPLSTAGGVAMLGGPILYLAGELAFRARMIGRTSRKRIVAIVGLAALAPLVPHVSALALAAAVAAVLTALALWEFAPTRPARAAAARAT